MSQMTAVATYIHKEMIQNLNHGTAKRIHSLNNPSLIYSLSTSRAPHDSIEALSLWRSMVGGGKKWDHKAEIKKKFGHWAYDDETHRRYNFDIWSNIHYGYVGKYVGFRDWTLKSGAGFAQWRAGTNPSGYWKRRKKNIGDADVLAAFDDPCDQVAIVLGMELWESRKRRLSAGQLVEAVRDTCKELNTMEGSGAVGQCRMKPPVPEIFRPKPRQSYLRYGPAKHPEAT